MTPLRVFCFAKNVPRRHASSAIFVRRNIPHAGFTVRRGTGRTDMANATKCRCGSNAKQAFWLFEVIGWHRAADNRHSNGSSTAGGWGPVLLLCICASVIFLSLVNNLMSGLSQSVRAAGGPSSIIGKLSHPECETRESVEHTWSLSQVIQWAEMK